MIKINEDEKILSIIMNYIKKNNLEIHDDYPIYIKDLYCSLFKIKQKFPSDEEFINKSKLIKTNFFQVNKIRRKDFLESLLKLLNSKISYREKNKIESNFTEVDLFISKYFKIGLDANKSNERDLIIKIIEEHKKPHDKMMTLFNKLLSKIKNSYQLNLHGVKEYSGIDLVKEINHSNIGIQIKTKYDNIEEDKLRAQVSKALEQKIDGFVLVYARKMNKKVDTSIQALYHHFNYLNREKKMCCFIIDPRLLAELFRKYKIIVTN